MPTFVKNMKRLKYIYPDDHLTFKDAANHFGFNIGYFFIWVEKGLKSKRFESKDYVQVGDVVDWVSKGKG